MLPFYAYLN
jgi:hypothetical protein